MLGADGSQGPGAEPKGHTLGTKTASKCDRSLPTPAFLLAAGPQAHGPADRQTAHGPGDRPLRLLPPQLTQAIKP